MVWGLGFRAEGVSAVAGSSKVPNVMKGPNKFRSKRLRGLIWDI